MTHRETEGYQRIKELSINYVKARKIGDQPGIYEKEAGQGQGFYGSYHAAHVLDLFHELEKFPEMDIDAWAAIYQSKQCDFGHFVKSSNQAGEIVETCIPTQSVGTRT